MSGRFRTSVRKTGQLFLRAHGDCFLHVTAGWLSYWPISQSTERLMLVRVTLPNGHHFLTTLCPSPLSYNSVWRGVARERYIEIDTNFAKQLGITTPDIQVVVDAVSDIERCTELCLEPVSPDDLEKLEENHGKIEYELLSRIRVVSGQSFSFPIWIDSAVIPVRVVSSVPAAKWVLLGSEETGARGERATAVRFKKGIPSPSTSSSSSYTSPTESDRAEDSADPSPLYDQSEPSWSTRRDLLCATGLGSGSEESTPDSEVDNASVTSSAGSRLFEMIMRPFFTATNSHQSFIPSSNTERSGTRTPEPATASAPPTVYKSQPTHKKTKSWSHPSDPGSLRVKLPKYVETPEMDALLRVQPHSIGGPDKYSMGENRGCSPPQWEYSRIFDAYVHPSTFPEISNYYHCSKHLGSFLVQVRPVIASPKAVSQVQANQNETDTTQLAPADPLPVQDAGSAVSSPASETRLELSRIISAVAGFTSSIQDADSDTSDGGSSTKSEKPQKLTFATSLVLRLCFATKLVSCSDDRVRPLPHPPPVNDLDQFTESNEELKVVLKVAPGHIVMSDVVRQQLQISTCSLIRVSHVVEEGRLPAGPSQVTVHVRPLGERDSIMLEHRQKLEASVKSWVLQVRRDNPFGAVLVNNQIVPLLDYRDECCYCSLEIVASRRKSSQQHRLLNYLIVSPQDFTAPNRYARVKIVVDKSQVWSGGGLTMPSLAELDPAPITLNPSHFGAFDELIERGSVFLSSALLQRTSHKPKGRLLISGSTGAAGLSCGKTSLAQLLVQRLTAYPTYAHVQIIDCTTLRAQTAVRVGKRLKEIFESALHRQPSLVVLDNLHDAMPFFSDVEEQMSGDGLLSMKKAQALLDHLSALDQSVGQMAVIATTRCRQDLHPMLLQSRGLHVFEEILEIQPPDLAGRESILSAAMKSRAVHLDTGVRQIAMKTEGCHVGDLANIVDCAIDCARIRHSCPDALQDDISTPVKKQVSFSFDGAAASSVAADTSPLMTRSLPASPLKEHRQLFITKSFSPTLTQRRPLSLNHVNLSTLTLVERTQSRLEIDEEGKMRITARDFHVALKGFVPLSLRGLSLHSAGTVDFSHVGGMEETKKVLRETIEWPSKYPKLFSQCPIRMCRGVLLYGPPGTGKTLLAGSIAKEFGLNFVSVKGPEILSKYIGASEQAVRDLFMRAQAAKPCVLFFDEFDSLAPKRGQDRTGVTDRVVNQLLTQLDGVETLEGVYMVAATSRPDLIDPALLRPGRIDKSILCDHPNETERLDILRALSKDMSLQSRDDLRHVAHETEDYTGADLKAILYSAQLRAAHRVLDEERKDTNTVATSSSADTASEGTMRGEPASTVTRVMVCRLTSPAEYMELQANPDLEQRAVTLQQLNREAMEVVTLQQDIHGDGDRKRLSITLEDLTVALKDVKPSISVQERQRFTDIYDRFTGKIPPTLKAVINQRATMA